MGLPICRDPPAEPRETERDPTASARSNIRRRLHRRRNGGTSDVLRRNSTRLDQDRRSSQQVLLDLLQFTSQDNNNSSSSSTSNSGLTSAATTASSTVNAVSVGAGSPAASQAWYRRGDATAFPPLFSTERERRGDPLDPPVRGTAFDEAYSLLPPFLSPGLRIIRHSSTGELTLPPDRSEQDREQGRGQEREFEREFEREALERLRASMERNREQNERFAREFRNRPHMLWSSRPGNSSNTDAEELPSYLRESSRRVERAAQFMQSMREQMRELNNTIPDVMGVSESGRSRGSQIDGLGDRDRSLSPDRSAWYFPNPAFPDLGMHCEYASDGESDGDEDRAGWIDTVTRPRTPVWGEVVPSRPDSALERFRSRRAALLLLRNEVSRAGGRGDESPLRVNITGEP